ncbi:MvdC family ATP-grasp ribosomal peptide maturase [Myxococcaceae bacterium GXIMD 01537]
MSSARDAVLLITHSGDFYTVDRVAEELARLGARPVRLDIDGFPMELELSLAQGGGGGGAWIRTAAGTLRADEVQAVWLRRLASPRFDEGLEEPWRTGCARESQAAVMGFLDALEAGGSRFVNPLDAGFSAGSKPRQLRQAQALGLDVPRTLVTNDAGRVRAFFDEVGGRVVVKMLTALSQSMDASGAFLYTRALEAADLEELDGLSYSPMVFQERVDKAYELRVAVVGGRCFVGAMDASGSVAGQVDWRRARRDECQWRAGTLPAEVAARLVRLVEALGLVYGAADFIVTPEGRHVFLELNPGGEWGMLERELGLPIAAALAEALAGPGGGSPPRRDTLP